MFLYKDNKTLLGLFTINELTLSVGLINLWIAAVVTPPLEIDELAASGILTRTSIATGLFKKVDAFCVAEQRRINPPIRSGQLLDEEALPE